MRMVRVWGLVGRRLLVAVPVLFGVSLLVFGLVNVMPGSAAEQLLGADATPEQVRQLERELSLDRPVWRRYLDWLKAVSSGDFGRSLASRQSVEGILGARLPITLELACGALLLALGLSVPLALLAARRPNGIVDRLITAVCMAGLSAPNYVIALALVVVFSVQLGAFPSMGFVAFDESLLGNIRAMTLPTIALATPLLCVYVQFLRGDLVEQGNREMYVAAARARGMGPWRVLIRHVLPNSLLGLLTVVGLNLGPLVGGTVIVEQIFSLPGVGQALLQAILTRDVVVVQAVVLMLAFVTIAANLTVDLLYSVLDPRVRYARD